LGADVPACLEGGISLGLGYGDHMQRLDREDTPRHHWVMCTMEQGLSTPAVFKHFDSRGEGRDHLPKALRPADEAVLAEAEVMREVLQNDLEASAKELHPTLARAWKTVEEAGPLAVMLSGSGPTIAALARDEEHAREIAQNLASAPEIASTIEVWGPSDPAKVE
ncbi:MAG: 4-(cytidine 5'-diphospho)-2-C-methyl-D-erythritol kinase, partial [Actinomycetaceae bacterium]|nr:4-(cytidine 5'-diphospho)-2-C-methyl-D-erythritol kinase [Actinomycetaceae bacterium]